MSGLETTGVKGCALFVCVLERSPTGGERASHSTSRNALSNPFGEIRERIGSLKPQQEWGERKVEPEKSTFLASCEGGSPERKKADYPTGMFQVNWM